MFFLNNSMGFKKLLGKLQAGVTASGRLEMEALSPFYPQVTLSAKSFKVSLHDIVALSLALLPWVSFALDTPGAILIGNTPFKVIFFFK